MPGKTFISVISQPRGRRIGTKTAVITGVARRHGLTDTFTIASKTGRTRHTVFNLFTVDSVPKSTHRTCKLSSVSGTVRTVVTGRTRINSVVFHRTECRVAEEACFFKMNKWEGDVRRTMQLV